MIVINSAADLIAWAMARDGLSGDDATVLVAAVLSDPDGHRPDWGGDWSSYLDRLDIDLTVLTQSPVFLPRVQ